MANAREDELAYPLGAALPAPGGTIELAPGVRWVRMRLPFALDHINLWLLRDRLDGRDGWAIVDCGVDDAATRAAWETVFATQLDGLPVLRVFATHMHPDHIGLAHWLTARWNCRLWMSATDWNAARVACRSTSTVGGPTAAAFFASHGLSDPDALEQVRRRANHYASLVPDVPAAFRRIMDGTTLDLAGRTWHCIAGYGHAPEHMALHCPELGLLVSGDMVLPRISTNISVFDPEPEANPLALYLESLQRYRLLPADTLVLPSHGKPFRGLHERVAQLAEHHEERCAEVLDACTAQPRAAAELLKVIFKRPLDLHETTFAMGEAVAHAHALWHDGRLRRERSDDGAWRFGLPQALAQGG